MATAPVFLPGESHGQRTLAGYSQWGRKESDTTERLKTLLLLLWVKAASGKKLSILLRK